jgi:pilus assembly protein Flp/PilA
MLKLYTKAQVLLNSLKNESGQDLIEYAIVAALITAGTVGAISSLATQITTLWTNLGAQITTALS